MCASTPDAIRTRIRRRLVIATFISAGGFATLATALRATREPTQLSYTMLNVGLPGLPTSMEGNRVAFVTDLHYGPDTPPSTIENAITYVLSQAPDLILLGGDYVQWSLDHLSGVIPILARLQAPLGVYGVLGNHDYYRPNVLARRIQVEAGIRILRNEGVDLDGGLFLCGIEDTWRGQFDSEKAMSNRRRDTGMIALTHNPVGINLFRNAGAFVLSGHTHGGQVLVPGLQPHRAPGLGDFPILQGWYGIHTTAGFISRGIGQTMLPIRLNCPPEIVIATLYSLPAGNRCQAV
jgi:hypothetical protein